MAAIIAAIPAHHRPRLGVCVDSCHLYAAGYGLVTDFDGVWRHFDDVLGRDRLRAIHLNDSKTPLGSRRDRHELIGQATLGPAAFRRFMTDNRFAAVPKVIETPKLVDTLTDRRMLRRLRGYAVPPRPRNARTRTSPSPATATKRSR